MKLWHRLVMYLAAFVGGWEMGNMHWVLGILFLLIAILIASIAPRTTA